jgi:hypothetical protein
MRHRQSSARAQARHLEAHPANPFFSPSLNFVSQHKRKGETDMNFTRMLICESLADDQVPRIVTRMQEYVPTIADVVSHSILAEEGGRMVILITDWKSREACLQHHTSRLYRQFVSDTQHLLVGSYVVKLFQNQTERRCQ